MTAPTGVLRTGALSMVGLIALGGTRVVHGVLVGRAAGPEAYGTVSALIGLAMAASLFLPSGLGNAASRYIAFHLGAGDPGTARRAYRMLTAAGFASAVLLGVAVALLGALLPGVELDAAVAVGALTAVYSAYSVAKGALYGFDRIVPYTVLELTGAVVAIGATVVVVVTDRRDYLLPLTVGYAVLMLGALVTLRQREPRAAAAASDVQRLDAKQLDVKELAAWVGWASLGGGASAGLLQLLPVLAGRFTTRAEVGYFGAAVTLVAPLFFLPRAVSLALFPAMARAHGAGDADVVRRHVDISTRALLALLAPIFAAGILVAAVNSLSSGDGLRITVYASVGGAVAGLAALVPLGHWLGAAGVAIAYLIAVAITTAVPLAVVRRRYELAWTGPTVRSLAVVAAALAAAMTVDAATSAGGVRTVANLLTALVVAGGGVLLLRRDIAGVLARRRGSIAAMDEQGADRAEPR